MARTIDVTMIAYREPDIARNIKAWLPHAKRVIVVVGATSEAARSGFPADDHATLRSIRDLPDPERQIKVITRAGKYWTRKNDLCLAALEHCHSDLVWQVDADEYYRNEHIERARTELADDNWELAGMPHLIFWKSLKNVLAHRDKRGTNDTWFRPARIWRRREREAFLHLPFNRIRRSDGKVLEVGCRYFEWGRCFHVAWLDDARVRFRFRYHGVRTGMTCSPFWMRDVWERGAVPKRGVHPHLEKIFPAPYSGPLPEALR